MKKRKIALALVMALGMTLTYGIKADCAVYNGWEKSNGYWYYYKNGNMCTGWQRDGSTWYYMNSDGTMKTGWVSDGSWYYLKADGSMATGWQNVNGTWYYFNGNGSMKTGWLNDGGTWYYLNGDGSMKTGWLNTGSSWYYMDSNGAMVKGWYHELSNGTLAGGSIKDYNGKQYYFNKDGAWVENTNDLFIVSLDDMIHTIDKTILVTVVNNSDNDFEFCADQNYIQKKDENGLWNLINIKKDSAKVGNKTVKAHSSISFNIDVDTFESGKLEAGQYKVFYYLGDKYYEYAFDVKEPDWVSCMTDKTSYNFGDGGKIKYIVTNYTDSELKFDKDYKIQKIINGEWKDVTLKSQDVSDGTVQVKPNENVEEQIDLSSIDEKEAAGYYRLIKNISGKQYTSEFELTVDKTK